MLVIKRIDVQTFRDSSLRILIYTTSCSLLERWAHYLVALVFGAFKRVSRNVLCLTLAYSLSLINHGNLLGIKCIVDGHSARAHPVWMEASTSLSFVFDPNFASSLFTGSCNFLKVAESDVSWVLLLLFIEVCSSLNIWINYCRAPYKGHIFSRNLNTWCSHLLWCCFNVLVPRNIHSFLWVDPLSICVTLWRLTSWLKVIVNICIEIARQ